MWDLPALAPSSSDQFPQAPRQDEHLPKGFPRPACLIRSPELPPWPQKSSSQCLWLLPKGRPGFTCCPGVSSSLDKPCSGSIASSSSVCPAPDSPFSGSTGGSTGGWPSPDSPCASSIVGQSVEPEQRNRPASTPTECVRNFDDATHPELAHPRRPGQRTCREGTEVCLCSGSISTVSQEKQHLQKSHCEIIFSAFPLLQSSNFPVRSTAAARSQSTAAQP